MVKILIGNITTKIVGFLQEDIHQQLDEVLSYKVKDAHYLMSVKRKRWDGIYHLYKKHSGQSFYTGLLSLAEEVLRKNNIAFTRVDERIIPPQNLPDLKFTPQLHYNERDYQKFTIDRSIQKTRGVLKICTGGGKTMVAAEIIGKIKTYPFMFYVLTEDLMNQAYETLSETLNEPIGRIGGGEFDIKKINVCTIQTAIMALNMDNKSFKISDYKFDEEDIWDEKQVKEIDKKQQLKELIGKTKGLFFDECHHASAKTVRDVISASPFAYWKYGLSATPFREDGAEIMIQALFGRKIVDISASYLIDRGYLIEPYILFDSINHNCKLHAYQSIYKECISGNDEFNNHVADIANHLIVRGLSVLVLVQHYPQGEYLKKLIPETEFLTGKMNRIKRKQAIQDLKDRKRLCLISTNLADEGLDIPTLDAALLAGGGASSTRVHQRIGRTLRIDRNSKNPRDKSIVVYFQHEGAKYLDKHAKKAKNIIKLEPRFKIIESGGQSFICNEIDEIMELGKNENKTTINDI